MRCQRCRTPSRRAGIGEDSQRRARSVSRGSVRSSDVGWFNSFAMRSQSRDRSPGHQLPVIQCLEACEWPPCFDTNGPAFVFDSRSGMFYESRSDFFYDPKSKLYYGNKKGAYFRYDDSKSPPFVEVHKVAPAATDAAADVATGLAGKSPESPTDPTEPKGKTVIAIKLKSKKPKGVEDAKPIPLITKAQKDHVANIEKWSEKRVEIESSEGNSNKFPSEPPQTVTETPSSETSKIVTTAKGEPICTICKRKFPTIEKLRLHEKVSDLHKQNILKLAADTEKRKLVPSTEYQDRAKKRREMHGADPTMPPPKSGVGAASMETSSSLRATTAENLGSDNIGNQLLQKLGWKGESSLGRKSEELAASETFGEQTIVVGKVQSQEETLRKDWDRIEAMAGNSARRST